MIKDLESIFIGSHAKIMDAFTSLEKSNKSIITSDKWKRDCLLYTSDAADE